ncbi:hypothetical protein [Deinococcus aerophilus]|uniref:DUF1400 domain-containing protein n=1 Tax=Deinococcus aerophilus TaxID=522488 RepID=A0ABQ2GHY4_9DEIO|nr:hypothetical protein [Deinococcus aerophilus]GGL96460.1 hypothetical protein GCM10010841_01060 [Deinococcus aerophilus]
MKKFLTTALFLLSSTVFAQTMSKVTGYQAIVTLGNARGITPALTEDALKALKVNTAAYKVVNEKLRISPDVFSRLFAAGNTAVPVVLLTRAVLESATGKTLTDAAVAELIRQNPSIAVTNTASLITLIANTELATLANAAAALATQPITPRGGGN